MKNDSAESSLITDFISRMSLAYDDIAFRFINNGNVVFSTSGDGDRLNTVSYTHLDVYKRQDFISVDVSFISLSLIFPVASDMIKDSGKMVCLIKPQFEAGREQVGKKGIVRDRKVHVQVIENVIKYTIKNGLRPAGLTYSPVTGAKGNIEFLLYIDGKLKQDEIFDDEILDIREIVNTSHEELE